MAKLKRIDEAEKENKKLRDVQFEDFPLEQFSDAGRVANEGDPQLKAAADTELYELEKHAIHIDIDKHEYDNSSPCADDNSSRHADDNSSPRADDIPSLCADDNTSQRADDNSSQSADDDTLQMKLVTCNYLQSARNTMLIIMIIHSEKWFTDQHMCHTMKTARNYCCRKQQICHEKTI